MHRDYIDAGFRVMPLHPILAGNKCGCGDPKCKMGGKHPLSKGWEHTPLWSDEQLETMESMGHFRSGFGVLCDGWLIIDVDARNGGVDSFAKLHADIPELSACGFIVETGSGGGSRHYYWRLSGQMALMSKMDKYPGIDFKSSGFVVGAASRHQSGKKYSVAIGAPSDVLPAPAALLELLARPEKHRTRDNDGRPVDVGDDELSQMLSHINPDIDYEHWVRLGMAIHHVTAGSGLHIWRDWSAKGSKFDGPESLDVHWHSFGKCANPVAFGTLVHYASQGGWVQPVTFDPPEELITAPDIVLKDDLWDDSAIDLLRPPGFVGKVAEWINGQCRYPRERLAAAAALWTVGSVAGLRIIDARDGVNTNLMVFGVAGSGTGKESVLQAVGDLIKAADMHPSLHGSIKSEQEVVRNLIRHQSALYAIDEFGVLLGKVMASHKTGGASYLQGVIGILMAAYSKSSGVMLLTGDQKDEMKKELAQKIAALAKSPDSNDEEIAMLEKSLHRIDGGLERPFLSLIGFTTPVTFDGHMTREQAQNGFLARALLVEEPETNPRHKANFRRKPPMDETIARRLQLLAFGGNFDTRRLRVEWVDEPHELPTDKEADALLVRYAEAFHGLAEAHKDTGMEPVWRRAYEMGLKASAVCAAADGVRTAIHVRWGMALARRDAETKVRKALANDAPRAAQGIYARILELADPEGDGMTMARLVNRMPKYRREDIALAVEKLIKGKLLSAHKADKTPNRGDGIKYKRIAGGAGNSEALDVMLH